MKKDIKEEITQTVLSFDDAHRFIKKCLDKQDIKNAAICLEETQASAIQVGTTIEDIKGEGIEVFEELEEYIELLYQIHEEILNIKQINISKIYKRLNKNYIKIYNSICDIEIQNKKEVVFLPYKASMWDSFETVWGKMKDDDTLIVKVIPIPYYDKNSDSSLGQIHYEGDDFPDNVPIVHYDNYDFEKNIRAKYIYTIHMMTVILLLLCILFFIAPI